MLGSSKSLRTTATRAQYLPLPLAMAAQPRELASESVIPRPAALQLTSQACPSRPIPPSRSPKAGSPVAALSLSLGLPQLGLLRKSSRIAAQGMACWQGTAWQGRTGCGSDVSSLTDDGIAMGQTSPHPGQPGAILAASWACRLFQPVPTPLQCDVLFSALHRCRVGTGFPSDSAARQRSVPAATKKLGCLSPRDPEDQNVSHIGWTGRAPRIWGGALCEPAPSSNHNGLW